MRVIHKYPLGLTDSHQILRLPVSAKPLSVQLQGRQLCLWAEIDTEIDGQKEVVISTVGTGRPIPPGAVNYLGTVQAGNFVWHVYASTAMGVRA